MTENKLIHKARVKKINVLLGSVAVLCLLLMTAAFALSGVFGTYVGPHSFLLLHNLSEMTSILVAFAIFVVSYYSYDQTKLLRTMLIGCVLLFVCILDIFHTLSYNGMPDFLIPNSSANRATTIWIISRMVAALGFMVTSALATELKSNFNKRTFLIPTIILPLLIVYLITYFPGILPEMFIDGQGITPVKVGLEVAVIIVMGIAGVNYYRNFHKTGDELMILLGASIVIGILGEVIFTGYITEYDIFNFVGHIFKALSYFLFFKAVYTRNVRDPYLELKEAQEELKDYVGNLDKLVEKRTNELKLVNDRLLIDLDYAREMQRAILPGLTYIDTEVEFHAEYFPTQTLSGDFFDYYRVDEKHVVFYISDVSGHGVPAALLTVFLTQCIEARRDMDSNSNLISFPSVVLGQLFDSFNDAGFRDDMYLVIFYALYNTSTGRLIYCSAGLNAPPFIIRENGEVEELFIRGIPICKLREVYKVEYSDTFMQLNKGDKIMLYTDGLVDAANTAGEKFTKERLQELLQEHASKSAKEITSIVNSELNSFAGNKKFDDDITFFVMETKYC